ALAALRTAEERWRRLGAPYETARTKLLIGRACEQLGDLDSARMEGDAARQIFADLGATVGVDYPEVEDEAESHGLTARELEVLRLVATGTTNQAIADELHLSTKTIDRHVGNILTKLGVTSRTAATAFAYQHQML
ncbi:MAG TPA: LuxR C-terminal-related transcriptional regulator, partial [Acidimicrobiia bacterium]